MNRPSFQFYPADWLSNLNLRRCSFHLKGVWADTMCLMHDSEEYGILRWTLQEIANAVGCQLSDLQELLRYGVMKGKEKSTEKVSFSITISKRNKPSEKIILIDSHGPLYFSSRMVRDEYIRNQRGQHGIKSLENSNVPPRKEDNKGKDKEIEKDTFSPSPSSSSSSSSSDINTSTLTCTADTQKTAEDENSNKESKPTSTQEVKTAPDESGNPEQRVEAKGRQTRKKTTDPRVKQFIDFAFQEHKKKFGQPLFITPGKDGELVKELLKTFELSFLKELYVDLINSDDQFFQKVGYGINVFYPSINKLAANHGKPNRGRKPLTSEELVEDFLKREEAKNGRV